MDLEFLKKTYDRISAIAQCSDTATIAEVVDQIAHSVGASSHVLMDYGTRNSGHCRVLTASSNSRFADAYAQLEWEKSDPVPSTVIRGRRPVTADMVRDQPGGAELVSRFMAETGIQDFVVVPVFKQSHVVGGLGFHFSDGPASADAGFVAGLVAPTLFEQADTLAPPQERSAGQNPLTPRELECLIWSADGKTSWEISEILEVSERTVNAHLGRAIRKLGVVSRTQAVAEAIRRGLFK